MYRLLESGGSLCLNAIRGGNAQWRTTMSHAFQATVMIAAVGALSGMAGERLYAQGADPNAAPNPYKMQENWAQLPEGRKFGAAIKVQIDHSDGKSIWVFDRCADGEVRFLGQISGGDRRGHVRGSARFLCRPRWQCVGRRPDRQERQGCRSHQVCSRRQGVDDFGQAGNARQRSRLFEYG